MERNKWLSLLRKERRELLFGGFLKEPRVPSFLEFPIRELPHARYWVAKARKERWLPQGAILEVVSSRRLRFGAILLYSSLEEREFLLKRIGIRRA